MIIRALRCSRITVGRITVKRLSTISLLICIVLLFLGGCTKTDSTLVTIGTGGVTGIYYPTGNAIARLVNKKSTEYGIRCTVESTGGSVFNVNAIFSGDLDFGVVQSDRQYQAWHGLAEWEEAGPVKTMRSVFSIHPETVSLIADIDSDIETIQDLKGKRVNIGNPGSGQRQNAIDALAAGGLDWKTDLHAEGVKADAAPTLLQDGRIDAFFYTVGHPSGNLKEATSGRKRVRFIPISGEGVDSLIRRRPFYARAIIPGKDYPRAQNDSDIETFGVKATLVTSVDTPDHVVDAVVREVFTNLEFFKTLHPAYARLTPESMLEGLAAPLHPAAERFFRENGLLK